MHLVSNQYHFQFSTFKESQFHQNRYRIECVTVGFVEKSASTDCFCLPAPIQRACGADVHVCVRRRLKICEIKGEAFKLENSGREESIMRESQGNERVDRYE